MKIKKRKKNTIYIGSGSPTTELLGARPDDLQPTWSLGDWDQQWP